MKILRWSLQLHKWVGLIVGVQVLFWVLGGLIMTAVPIERVRSEHHVAEVAPATLRPAELITAADAAHIAGFAPVGEELRSTPRGPVWVLKRADGEQVVLNAADGAALPDLTDGQVRAFAKAAYKGDASVTSVRLMPQAPQETGREGPLWRVDFDDAEKTAFYLSPATGEVVTRRSNLWRFYDFFWRLHIMDLKTGENFNHPLIVVAAALTLSIVITGFVLLWIRLGRDLQQLRRPARPRTAPQKAG